MYVYTSTLLISRAILRGIPRSTCDSPRSSNSESLTLRIPTLQIDRTPLACSSLWHRRCLSSSSFERKASHDIARPGMGTRARSTLKCSITDEIGR